MKYALLVLIFMMFFTLDSLAQTKGFMEGDRVTAPDGRSGMIESLKMPDMAKVKFDDGTTGFYVRSDLKKIEASKPQSANPPENFRVGDTVINPSMNESFKRDGKIESISGETATVRTGPYKYDYYKANLKDLMSVEAWQRRQNSDKNAKLERAAFDDETKAFHNTIYGLAQIYNPKFNRMNTRIPQQTDEIEKMKNDLEAVAAVCQKYPNLTNEVSDDDPLYGADIRMFPAVWCEMADGREALMKKMLLTGSGIRAQDNIGIWENAIREARRNRDGYVKDELQTLIFARAAFQQKQLKGVQASYAKAGEKIPAEILAPIFKQADELKEKIERDAATRSWTQPAYKDAALEGLVKAAYLKDFPGVRIFKTGMTYATWKAYDDTSLVRADTDVKIYKYERDKYRRKDGLILVQLPGQPLCQIRNFTLEQTRTGASFGAARAVGTAKGGIFVRCP